MTRLKPEDGRFAPFFDYFEKNKSTTGDCEKILEARTDSPTFEAYLSDTTTPTATVYFYGTVSGTKWDLLASISLSGAGDVGTFTPQMNVSYTRYKAYVQAISGTSAAVTTAMGY